MGQVKLYVCVDGRIFILFSMCDSVVVKYLYAVSFCIYLNFILPTRVSTIPIFVISILCYID